MKKLTMKTKPKNLTLSEIWKLYLLDTGKSTPELVGGILSAYYNDLDGTRQVKHSLIQKALPDMRDLFWYLGVCSMATSKSEALQITIELLIGLALASLKTLTAGTAEYETALRI